MSCSYPYVELETINAINARKAFHFDLLHPDTCPDPLFYQYAAERCEQEAIQRWGEWDLENPIGFNVRFEHCGSDGILVTLRGMFKRTAGAKALLTMFESFGLEIHTHFDQEWEQHDHFCMIAFSDFKRLVEVMYGAGWRGYNPTAYTKLKDCWGVPMNTVRKTELGIWKVYTGQV